ncbi:phage portal protein [Roseateles sp.]|uniref:anti-CBASS protein Acb1 family protein n=1 Tax=Roseateles sp. TaxID=1971397 RepID=UPI0031DCDFD8
MAEITTNTYDVARARADFIAELGFGLDAKRPGAWTEYGYKEHLGFDDFRRAYERGGAGHGAVQKLLARCWAEWPRIKKPEADEESPWEKSVLAILDGIKGWQKFQGFDRRNLIGRYAALIYRVADSKALREPLLKASKLVDIVPLFEDQIKVTDWHSDPTDYENYGKPRMFQYRTRSQSSTTDAEAKPVEWVDVHPSRVQILAEGADSDDFYEGVPLLKAGFNALVDIEKLSGGGAESALKNSARTIKFEYDSNAAPQTITTNPDGTPGTKSVREVHEEQTRKLNRSQDSAIVIQGGKADTLQTQVANLSPQFEIAANLFSASVGIPFTILFGQQTGRLASDEDQKEMNARAAARQRNELTPMLTEFVQRMQACGVFEAGDFEIEWKDLGAPTDEQKIDKALKMATINKTAFDGGATAPVFDTEEIRKAADYEERDGGGDEFREETPPQDPNAPGARVEPDDTKGAKPAPTPAPKK